MGSRLILALVFDSNIIIDALNGIDAGIEELNEAEGRIVSIISWMEVLAGCPTEGVVARAKRLLDAMEVVDISRDIAEAAVRIRRETRIKLPDAIVLATARISGCQLSTRNTKDFSEDDPTIRIPYRL